jgi:uncharacterized protein (DUF934 family)
MNLTPQLYIVNETIQVNNWRMFEAKAEDIVKLPPDEPNWMVGTESIPDLLKLTTRAHKVGLVVNTDYDIDLYGAIVEELNTSRLIEFIGINFPTYTDGRGFSLAWSLKREYGWAGELRAVGDVLIDTVNYLSRCGFNSFVLKDGHDPHLALNALKLFGQPYQNTN